jgi:uncharacterized protein (TIGR02266 family)
VKEAKSHCPYCTKEIAADDLYCPECAVAFGEETLLVTKDLVKGMLEGSAEVKRKHDRVPKKFKITYSSPRAFKKTYLSDIGKGGVFIKTSKILSTKEKVGLKIFLPDGGKELEVVGEVAWSRKEELDTPQGKRPPGMGIRFLGLSPENIARIEKILKASKS